MNSRILLAAKRLAWPALVCAAVLPAQAADPVVGSRLTLEQRSALPSTSRVDSGGQAFHVWPGAAADASRTRRTVGGAPASSLVVNAQGVVGESRHELLLSRTAPEAVRQAVGQLGLRPRSAQYYASTGISSLRFESFEQTVRARERLQAALPAAVVDLPIRYSRRTPR